MKILERGSAGPATVAVVGGIHGDEPAGERIVERLADELPAPGEGDGGGTIRLIVANEPALEAGTRYTDTDLNRAFPGDADSDAYERALAVRLTDALEGADAVLAIHTSHSAPPPFAIYSHLTDSVRRTVTGLPVEYVLDSSDLRGTTLDSVVDDAVSLEAGRQGSEEAVEFGYEAALDFLRAHGALADRATFTETTVIEGRGGSEGRRRADGQLPQLRGDPGGRGVRERRRLHPPRRRAGDRPGARERARLRRHLRDLRPDRGDRLTARGRRGGVGRVVGVRNSGCFRWYLNSDVVWRWVVFK
jgi:hypothetical protein